MLRTWNPCFCLLLAIGLIGLTPGVALFGKQTAGDSKEAKVAATDATSPTLSRNELVAAAIQQLVQLQNEDGAWPYEGVYRVSGQIPVGYRIGGTAIVCSALLVALEENLEIDRGAIDHAIEQGTRMILKELEHPLMKPKQGNEYDVRIWGHIYALDYFCRIAKSKRYESLQKETDPWIQKMVDAVLYQEIKSGGWNYANQTRHCSFVTAPAVQSLLLAKAKGIEIPDEVFDRAIEALEGSQAESGAVAYSGNNPRRDTVAGSIARRPVSETTLKLLGKGKDEDLQSAIDAFHEHWDELEKRRKQTGTHVPPHGIAPYYFYYGHRYLAQAIRMLPEEKRESEFLKFEKVLLKTKDDDHTWNDRVFERSKAFGTAMVIMALLNERDELPPALKAE